MKGGNKRGVDVLLIDTGDRHDGNGLSDATVPKGILIEKLLRIKIMIFSPLAITNSMTMMLPSAIT